MQITEPMTLATDYLLGGWTAVLVVKLFLRFREARQQSVLWWAVALLATAFASFFGGTFHGFSNYLSELVLGVLWKATVYSIGVASLCLLVGSVVAFVSPPAQRWLQAAAAAKFLVYAVWMATHNDFRYVIYDYAPAMVLVLVLAGLALRSSNREAAGWLMAGIVVSFLAAGIQQSGFALHEHFNHNDLYHVVQMGAIYLLYRGAAELRDRI